MTADLRSRISRLKAAMRERDVAGIVVTPGSDLRYLSGYDAMPLERLTALVMDADGDPVLVVPALEVAEANRSPGALAGMTVLGHNETTDAFAVVVDLLPDGGQVAVDDHMWASRLVALMDHRPAIRWRTAGRLLADLRMRKAKDEIASLRNAGAAIDRVHRRMGEFLRVGTSERQAADSIARAILDEGHVSADFTIVGSGPHSASPHHTVSDRVIEPGDVIVVDIGGSTSDGYCSDCTRTYAVGEPPDDVHAFFEVLLDAQLTQCDVARPGITAEALDRAGRKVISDAGFGENFMHRTGHGIGLDTHEDPYIVEGNTLVLEAGMAFSIEPGIYLPGRFGARIEDIVVTTDCGIERLNTTPRELLVLEG